MPSTSTDARGNFGDERLAPVASYKHTLGLLVIFVAVFAISFALQGKAAPAGALIGGPAERRISLG